MIVDAVLRIEVDDSMGLLDVGLLLEDSLSMEHTITKLETKFEVMPGRPRSHRNAAIGWLRNRLSGGPVRARRVIDDARAAGHSLKTLRRAADELGVKRTNQGRWSQWSLPEGG